MQDYRRMSNVIYNEDYGHLQWVITNYMLPNHVRLVMQVAEILKGGSEAKCSKDVIDGENGQHWDTKEALQATQVGNSSSRCF